jgi:N-acetylneuraminic acid mutarotase
MSWARDHLAVAVAEGKIYAVGGRLRHSFGANLDINEEYDPATDTWSARAPLPTTRSGLAAATLDGVIYAFGGEGPDGTFDESEAYDPASDSWMNATAMPTARHGLGSAVVDGLIYVVAGGVSPGSSDSAANETFEP